MQSSVVYFKQNKTFFFFFFSGVIGQHSHHYLFPLIFSLFLGTVGFKTLYHLYEQTRPRPKLTPQSKLEKISHLFHIYK